MFFCWGSLLGRTTALLAQSPKTQGPSAAAVQTVQTFSVRFTEVLAQFEANLCDAVSLGLVGFPLAVGCLGFETAKFTICLFQPPKWRFQHPPPPKKMGFKRNFDATLNCGELLQKEAKIGFDEKGENDEFAFYRNLPT